MRGLLEGADLIGDEGATGDPDARSEGPRFPEVWGVRELPGRLDFRAGHAGEGDVGIAAAVRVLPDHEECVRSGKGRDAGQGVLGAVRGDREDVPQFEGRRGIGRNQPSLDVDAADFDGLFPGDERAAAGRIDGRIAQIVFGRTGEEELLPVQAGGRVDVAALDHRQPGLVELFPDDEEGAVGGGGADVRPVDRAGSDRGNGPEIGGLSGRVNGADLDRDRPSTRRPSRRRSRWPRSSGVSRLRPRRPGPRHRLPGSRPGSRPSP